ncbi:MAG: hypothetical protein ACFFBD_02170 [Candidatus Hodarchaeota archaeon]
MDEVNEIIVIDDKGELILSSSSGGVLSQKGQLSAQITQTLVLFAEKVIKEPLQFVRFQNSLMVFVVEKPFTFVTLVPKETPASSFLPKIRLIARLLKQYHSETGILPQKITYDLATFYYTISLPNRTLIVAEKSGIGLLSVLTFLFGLKSDLNIPDIDQLVNNIFFVNETETLKLRQSIPNLSEYKSIISFFIEPDLLSNLNLPICHIGGSLPSDIFFIGKSELNRVAKVAEIFGDDTIASKVSNVAFSQEAIELADSIAIIPPSAREPVSQGLINALSSSPGVDIIMILTQPLLEYLKQLSKTREQQKYAREAGTLIQFRTAPIEIDASGFVSNIDTELGGITTEKKIIIRVGNPNSAGMIPISLVVNPERVQNLKELIDDILERFSLQVNPRITGLAFEVPRDSLETVLRSIVWLCFVEYMDQVRVNVNERTEAFDFPNDGSIMLVISPDYDISTFPSQVKSIVREEDLVKGSVPWEEAWQAVSQIDDIMVQLLDPLKNRETVAYVPLQDTEISEIMQFLVALSAVNGIGFSRW